MTGEMHATSGAVEAIASDEDAIDLEGPGLIQPLSARRRALLREAMLEELLGLVSDTSAAPASRVPAAATQVPGPVPAPVVAPPAPAPLPVFHRRERVLAIAKGIVGTVLVGATMWLLGLGALLPGGPLERSQDVFVRSAPPVATKPVGGETSATEDDAPAPRAATPAQPKPRASEPQVTTPQTPKPRAGKPVLAKPATAKPAPRPKPSAKPKPPGAAAKPVAPSLPPGLGSPAGPRRLAWAPVAGVDGYEIALYRGNTRVVSATSKTAAYDLRKRLAPGVYLWYVWSVRGGNRDGVAIVRATLEIT